jgi:putative ABC transport system substrate-binding protein
MRRRDFFGILGGAAVACPALATAQPFKLPQALKPAQQRQAIRNIAVLTGAAGAVSDARVRVLVQALGELGWLEARNVRFEIRHGGGNAETLRQHATELVALAPDVIVANGGTATEHLLRATRTIPIVFSFVPDPVGSGFVDSLSRPGGNATGFTQFEYGISAKWLELLKEISPSITRVAVLRDSSGAASVGQFAVIQAAAQAQQIDTRSINVRDAGEIERDVAEFAGSPAGKSGMIVVSSTNALVHRELIVKLAARHKLPTVYAQREFVNVGGLISYGTNITALLANAAGYVDRILKGAKPADLPVQAPTKFELVVNTKAALALGLEFPPTVLARAEDITQ